MSSADSKTLAVREFKPEDLISYGAVDKRYGSYIVLTCYEVPYEYEVSELNVLNILERSVSHKNVRTLNKTRISSFRNSPCGEGLSRVSGSRSLTVLKIVFKLEYYLIA